MEKLDNRKSALVLPDGEVVGALDVEVAGREAPIETQSTSGLMTRAPLPWIGSMPRASFDVMAVIDEEGYLVPLCTAGDLLRACKIMWQATAD